MLTTAPEETAPGRTINLDELQTETEKLLSLLKVRQPGLMTWNTFLHERITSVRNVLAGELPEAKKMVLTPRFSISSGGKPAKELKKMVKAVGELGSYAESMMDNKASFRPAAKAENVDLAVLTVKEFGFTENPRTDVLLDPKRLAKWSEENLDGQVLELCRAEDGPHLRAVYMDQPNGEVLWMGMERITDSGGDPRVFGVERGDDGTRWLYGYWAIPDDQWGLGDRVMFRLRKV